MYYLRLFETNAEYQQFIGGGDFLRPNVSLINDTKSLFYNPLVQEESELPYLTMTALEDDLTVSLSLNPCQYSLNGTDWNELQADEQTPAISSGDKIYFKAEGLTPSGRGGIGTFTVSKRFNLSGNVMSMLFGDDAQGKDSLVGYNSCFYGLFEGTPVVNVSPNFLPATTLADRCYMAMFEGCTSLVNAPELPATTLAESCYRSMFLGCTSLVTAPPELPATTLTESCYGGMFDGCTSLVQAPELPATTLANSCYYSMFYNCTSLNYIKMLATDISADYCLGEWVEGVSPTGTFVKSKDAEWDVTGKNGIPEGWTVETA